MNKILVVDDELGIREVIKEYLECRNFEVDTAEDGIKAEKCIFEKNYDLMILDIMMPIQDGFETAKHIREKSNIPIIMLSAKNSDDDKLVGFSMGIDDFVSKPFSFDILLARINAVLTRSKMGPYNKNTDDMFVYKGLKIDQKNRFVSINDNEVYMTPKEYELLFYFINNKDKSLSREQIFNDIWNGSDSKADPRTIDAHVKMLRNSLGEYRDIITTQRKLGYKCSF